MYRVDWTRGNANIQGDVVESGLSTFWDRAAEATAAGVGGEGQPISTGAVRQTRRRRRATHSRRLKVRRGR